MNESLTKATLEHALNELSFKPAKISQLKELITGAVNTKESSLDLKLIPATQIKKLNSKELLYLGKSIGEINSHIDPLTKTYRREVIKIITSTMLPQWIANSRFTGFLLVYIDLDKFGQINKLYGQHSGDVVLAQTASILSSLLRREDILIRMGGDEFIVASPQGVCTDCDPSKGDTKKRAIHINADTYKKDVVKIFSDKVASEINIQYEGKEVPLNVRGSAGVAYRSAAELANVKDLSVAFDNMAQLAGDELLKDKELGRQLRLRKLFRID